LSERRQRNGDAGNVIFIILIAIILLAALTYTVVRSSRSRGNLSPETVIFSSTSLMRAADDVHNAVQNLMSGGTDVTLLSFENAAVTGYTNATAAAVNKVFDPAGGALRYPVPEMNWLDTSLSAQTYYGQWYFPANLCVASVGSGATSCSGDAVDNEDIVMILPYIKKDICVYIDQKLGIPLCSGNTDACANSAAVFPPGNAKFTGILTDGGMIHSSGGEFDGKYEGCIQGTGGTAGMYYYYKVLVER
jgi:hypothetical protein